MAKNHLDRMKEKCPDCGSIDWEIDELDSYLEGGKKKNIRGYLICRECGFEQKI